MGKLILLLMALPVVDLYVLVRLGHAFGGGVAIGLMATSALAGILIARWKGLRELRAWRQALAQGRTPDQGVVHGLLVLLASIWLIMPGVISDVLGLSLLIPAIRRWVAARVTQHVLSAIQRGGMQVVTQAGIPPQGPWPGGPTPAEGWPGAERRASMEPGAERRASMEPGAERRASMEPGAERRASMEPGVIDVEGEIVQPDAAKDRTPKRLEP